MKTIYLITGAAGHLGNTLACKLLARGERVRAFVLPADLASAQLEGLTDVFAGDVRDPESLRPAFAHAEDEQLIVIHCAGLITIKTKLDPCVHAVNVDGTRNVIRLCEETGARKLIYVSSVHALPELPKGQTIREVDHFDPEAVYGSYAKTKAEASQLVLDAAKRGLDACVVHPSGLCGPGDYGTGHLTKLVLDWYNRTLTAGLDGGYDFSDVRDVADGILACCEKGVPGECYILSNVYVTVKEIFDMLSTETGLKRPMTILPHWFIRFVAPLAEAYYRLLRQTPLFTAYSIDTLNSNAVFSHEKASEALGYAPRPFGETLRDTVEWLQKEGRLRVGMR